MEKATVSIRYQYTRGIPGSKSSNESVCQVRNDACPGERRVNQGIVRVNAIDGGVFLAQITHVVIRACSDGKSRRQLIASKSKGHRSKTEIKRSRSMYVCEREGYQVV